MRKNALLKIVVLSSMMSLTACGGGGSESSPPTSIEPTPDPTLSMDSSSGITVSENSSAQASISVNYTGNESLEMSFAEPNLDALTTRVSLSGSTLSISIDADELLGHAEETGTLQVTVSAGSLSETAEISITALNTSLDNVLSDIAQQAENADSLSVSGELHNISTFLADKAYLYGILTNDEKSDWLLRQNEDSDLIELDVRDQLTTNLDAILSQQETLTESEVLSMLNDAREELYESGNLFMPILDNYAALSVPNFSIPDGLVISSTGSGYSLFYGNPAVGSGTADNWSFSGDFSILSKLIPSNGTLCFASNND